MYSDYDHLLFTEDVAPAGSSEEPDSPEAHLPGADAFTIAAKTER
jgi:hypothetical protein